MDHDSNNDRGDVIGTHTYLKLAPHASVEQVQQALPAMEQSLWTGVPKGWALDLKLVRMDLLEGGHREDAWTMVLDHVADGTEVAQVVIATCEHALRLWHAYRDGVAERMGLRREAA